MSVFTQLPPERILYRSQHFFIIEDGFPVSPGHLLIISNEGRADFFQLTKEEQVELANMILKAKELIELRQQPQGYNIGMNCGVAAGQTVMHLHCHVIPRYSGDMEDPKGGVRHCVKGKGYY